MQLDAFILADAVATPGDGKFYVHGGGVSRIEAANLPAQIQLGVLIQLGGIKDDDVGVDHRLRLTLFGPTGLPNVEPIELHTKFDEAGALAPVEEGKNGSSSQAPS